MRKNNISINFRVTDKEKKAIDRLAKSCGLSLSAYLRKVSLNQKPTLKPSDKLQTAYKLINDFLDKYCDHMSYEKTIPMENALEYIREADMESRGVLNGNNQDMDDNR